MYETKFIVKTIILPNTGKWRRCPQPRTKWWIQK